MAARDDILQLLDAGVRERIESDSARYAPFLALLNAWNGAVQQHVAQFESRVVSRLAQQMLPQGDWRFPAQALAVPDEPRQHEVSAEMTFTDRATGACWTPCGPGWTLPTRVLSWSLQQADWAHYALVLDVAFEGSKPDAPLLLPPTPPDDLEGQSQLAYLCGSERLVDRLARAPWAIQYAGGSFEPISAWRYEGYLDFEKALGAVRPRQRHLAAWLPPFHPYSRKFLHFALPAPAETPPAKAWAWLGQARQPIRLAALVDDTTASLLRNEGADPPVILNAIPVAQMRALSGAILEGPERVGDADKKLFAGIRGCFAATAREYRQATRGAEVVYHPADLARTESADPRADRTRHDIEVTCGRLAAGYLQYETRIYYESLGADATPPVSLSRPQRSYFSVPFPAVGGTTIMVGSGGEEGARPFWYHALLRPPLLTEGDVLEILSQLPACRTYLEMDPQSVFIQLDIAQETRAERTQWANWLWPSVVTQESLLEFRASYLTASRVPLIPIMRLHFQPSGGDLPAYLLEDLASYAASVLSQFFMLGWYRIEGRVGGT